jgi:hypothetical protein
MTNRDYKEGFDGGIDFALTFVGEAYDTKFADLNELVEFIERILSDPLESAIPVDTFDVTAERSHAAVVAEQTATRTNAKR